jgi:hypothetical protein
MLGLTAFILLSILGLCIAVIPVWQERQSNVVQEQEYDAAISELRSAVAKADLWEDVPLDKKAPKPPHSERNVEIPADTQKWLRPEKLKSSLNSIVVAVPGDMSDEDVFRTMQSQMLPRPAFSLRTALRNHRMAFLFGVALLIVNVFGCVWLVRIGCSPKSEANAR